jgi:hypothetical protein
MGAFDDLPMETKAGAGAFDDLPAEAGGFNQRAGSFATGVNAGLAALAGAPFDLSAWLGNKAAGGINYLAGREAISPVTKPWLGSENIRSGITGAVGETKPQDELDRLLYGAGAGTASAIGGMGIGGALGAVGRSPALARMLMGGDTPLPAAVGNVTTGAAGGAGSVAGEDLAAAAGGGPTAQFLAGTAGGLLGGAIGATIPTIPGNVYKAGAAAIRPFTEAGRRNITGRLLNESAIYGVPDLPNTPLGASPTLGQATNDPGLLSLERSVQQLTPAISGRFADQASRNNQTILEAFDELGQPRGRAPYQISQEAAPGLEANRAAARQAESAAWEAIDPTRSVQIPMQPIRERMNAYVNDLTMARRPLVPDDLLAMVNQGGDTLPMRELQDLRSALTTRERMARRTGDYNQANVFREMDQALFQRLPEGQVPMPATADQAATMRYQNALQASRDYQQTFGQKPIRDIFRVEGTPDSAVLDKMLAPGQGQAERVQQYVQATMQDPAQMQHGRDWFTARMQNALSSARQDAEGDQFILGDRMRKFVQDNRPLIDSPLFAPDQRRVVNELVDAATMVERTARAGPQGGSDTAAKLAGKNYVQSLVGGWFQPVRAAELAGGGIGLATSGGWKGALGGAAIGNRIATPLFEKAYSGARDKVMSMLSEAMLDPAFARELMQSARGQNTQFASPRMKTFLATLPATAGITMEVVPRQP